MMRVCKAVSEGFEVVIFQHHDVLSFNLLYEFNALCLKYVKSFVMFTHILHNLNVLNCFMISNIYSLKTKNDQRILSFTNIYQIILVHFYKQKRFKRFKLKSHSQKFCNEYVCFQNFTFLLCQLFDKNTFLQFSVLIIPRKNK